MAHDLVRFAGKYTPGSSLWYARLALERGVLDQLNIMADRKAKSKMGRTVKRYKKQYGQNYWWKPGNLSPARSPNLENMFEER